MMYSQPLHIGLICVDVVNFLIVSAVNSTLLAVIRVCSVPFGFGSLSRITFGFNRYTAVARNPDSMLSMVMLLHHTSENNDENWNFIIILLGCENKCLQQTSTQLLFNSLKQLVSSG